MEKNKEIIRELIDALKNGSCNNLTDSQLEKIADGIFMSDYVNDMGSKIDRLYDAVCGDDEMGHRGLVKRMDEFETWKRTIDAIKWKAVGILSTIVAFSQIIYYLIQKKI